MSELVQFSELVEINPRTIVRGMNPAFIGMGDVSEGGRIISIGKRSKVELSGGLSSFRDGDVLFAKITPCMENGKGAYVEGVGDSGALGSTEFHVLRARKSADSKFVYHWTRSPAFRRAAEAMMTGSAGQRRVPSQFFSRFLVPHFSVVRQRRIAEILDALDGQMERAADEMRKREVVRSGLAVDCVGEAIAKADRWEALGRVTEVASGVTLGSEPSGGSSVELPYLRVANVQDGFFDLSDIKSLRVLRSEVNRYSLRSGDLLLTEGGDWDKLGRGAVWDGRISPCLYQNHIFRIRCDRRLVMPEYLELYVSSPSGRAYFTKIAKQTSNLATINSTELKAMPIPVPPLDVQRALVDSLTACDMVVRACRKSLSSLESLRQGLAEDLLTGRVRV